MYTNDKELLNELLRRMGYPCHSITTPEQILNRFNSILTDAQRFDALCSQIPSPDPPNKQTLQDWLDKITSLRTIADLTQHIRVLDSQHDGFDEFSHTRPSNPAE